jgi:hypothetical protein
MNGCRISIVVQSFCAGSVLSQKSAKVAGGPGIMSEDIQSVRNSRIIANIAYNVKKNGDVLPVSILSLNPSLGAFDDVRYNVQ